MTESDSSQFEIDAIEERAVRSNAGQASVLIAAGGTGGHVIPAQAVAQALRKLEPDLPVDFVCGMRPVELRTYWNHSEHPYLLRCGKAPGTGWGGLQRWMQLLRVIAPAHKLISKLQPSVVLGMGGYIAAPVLLAACRRGIPFVMHESNAVAGRTTRLFSRWAKEVLLTHAAAAKGLARSAAYRVVGTPVRYDLFGISRKEGAEAFQLDPDARTILILGGSQGAHALNEAMRTALPVLENLANTHGRFQVLWSAGTADYDLLCQQVEKMNLTNVTVRLHPTIHKMGAAYAASDLVVSRAGSGTLSEISALGLPSILVPYPCAKDDHQRHNARSLATGGGALLLEESGLKPAILGEFIGKLLSDQKTLRRMADFARQLATPDAAEQVARILIDIAKERSARARATSALVQAG